MSCHSVDPAECACGWGSGRQMIGSAVCPENWSKHDQPEYPEATS